MCVCVCLCVELCMCVKNQLEVEEVSFLLCSLFVCLSSYQKEENCLFLSPAVQTCNVTDVF